MSTPINDDLISEAAVLDIADNAHDIANAIATLLVDEVFAIPDVSIDADVVGAVLDSVIDEDDAESGSIYDEVVELMYPSEAGNGEAAATDEQADEVCDNLTDEVEQLAQVILSPYQASGTDEQPDDDTKAVLRRVLALSIYGYLMAELFLDEENEDDADTEDAAPDAAPVDDIDPDWEE